MCYFVYCSETRRIFFRGCSPLKKKGKSLLVLCLTLYCTYMFLGKPPAKAATRSVSGKSSVKPASGKLQNELIIASTNIRRGKLYCILCAVKGADP